MTSNSFKRRHWLAAALSGLALAAPLSASAQAEAWPSKPIRLIVPYPPLGPTDRVTRPPSDSPRKQPGVQVPVQNKAGDGGHGRGLQKVQSTRDAHP